MVLLEKKIVSYEIFRQTFCCIYFPFQRQGDEDIPVILWLMGVSRRIIFRELGKGPRKYKAKRVQKRRNCYFASREDVTCIFFPYCQILVRVELIYFSFST